MPLLGSAKFLFIFPKVRLWSRILWQWMVPFKQGPRFSGVSSPIGRHSAWSPECWYHDSSVTSKECSNISPERHAYTPFCYPLKWFNIFRELKIGVLREQLSLSGIWREHTGRQRRSGVKQLCDFLMSNHICAWTEPAESPTYVCAQNIMPVLILMMPYLTDH